MEARPRERITTWAAIAAYIGRDERTARRYEVERALPVRRMPGERKSTVYALAAELDNWLARTPEPPDAAAVVSEPADAAGPSGDDHPSGSASPTAYSTLAAKPARWPRRFWMIAILAVVAAGASLALAAALTLRPAPGSVSPDAEARSLYQQGVYAWNRRTREGVAEAIDRFTQAIVRAPGYAAAYAGLADAYDIAPEFGGLSPTEAYPRAQAAAERAIALDPGSAAAHRALAFVDFWWVEDVARARSEFETALRLDPHSAQTLHWYANALAERGDPRALTLIDRAFEIDPSLPVMADRGFVLMMLDRTDAAQAVVDQVVKLDPDYAPAYSVLIGVEARRGDDAAMLAAARKSAVLAHDANEVALLDAAAAALAHGGRPAMLQLVGVRREQMYAAGQTSAFRVAIAESDLRRRSQTLAMLRRARADHDPAMLFLARASNFAWLRPDPAFRSLAP